MPMQSTENQMKFRLLNHAEEHFAELIFPLVLQEIHISHYQFQLVAMVDSSFYLDPCVTDIINSDCVREWQNFNKGEN